MSATEPSPPLKRAAGTTTHLFLLLLVFSCVAFGAWATIGTLDIVSLASGEVIPSSQVKSVQHLEGGIVREISVSEGQLVSQGQKLVVLEPTNSGADVRELGVRLRSLRAEIARLEAEAAGIRSTGIGCYFDDPMHQVLGLKDRKYQDLYHFTVGGPVIDTRLTTLPPYPDE
mgnify:CR=1 FL=1